MGTYYRWTRYNVDYTETRVRSYHDIDNAAMSGENTDGRIYYGTPQIVSGKYVFSNSTILDSIGSTTRVSAGNYFSAVNNSETAYYVNSGSTTVERINYDIAYKFDTGSGYVYYYRLEAVKGSSNGYAYSTNPSAYPTDGISGDYWYSDRTTVTSPTAPASITYPNPITSKSVTVSWGAASTNVPSYGVSSYELSYSINGGASWTVAGKTSAKSLSVTIPNGTTSVQFRVRAKDSNGQWGDYTTGSRVNVFLAPTLTAPSLAMQGQDITLNWTAIDGATSYTLQRKASTDEDWVEVYSGAALTFTETVGTWTGVQYRAQADFDGVTGDWATSASIPVVSDSALVISGQDGDLGTLVNDVPYTISTDTGNQITVRTTVNGFVILEGTVPSGTAERIPVLDLVHGTGTIVIEASVETDGGTVSAARIWTYNKAAMTFPNAGSPAQLTKEGENIWPKTLAECVRLPGGRTLEEVMGFPCQIYVGRYTGTGTYGSGDPNEVTIPFKPQAVFVTSGSVGTTIPMIRPCTSAKNSSATLTVTWEDDGVSWYSTSAANQLNAAGTTYDIVAFG